MDAGNTHQVFDWLWTSGQLSARDIDALPALGIEMVVNLAPPTSSNALQGEAERVTGHGMVYVQIPVAWERPEPAQFTQFAGLLESGPGRKVWVHCALNMRASAFVHLYRRLVLGEDESAAGFPMREVWTPDATWQAFIEQVIATYPGPAGRRWQRRVAVDCNNRAWELSVAARSPDQDREMLDAAHTAAFHWARVGSEVNRMRATMLLAEVHALLGHGGTALGLAEEMRSYFLARGDTPDWEVAFTHAIHAHCAHAAGDGERHRASYAAATVALGAIVDDEDRRIVAQTLGQVPAP